VATNAFLGLEVGASGLDATVVVTDALANPRGTFYGGAAVAVVVALMEAVTERPPLWTTVQFVSTPVRGDRVDLHVDVLAHGARMSQLRVTASKDGAEVFTAFAASGVARDDTVIAFEHMPVVPPPLACEPAVLDVVGDVARSYFAAVDRRVAAEPDALRDTGTHAAFWVRVPGMVVTAPLLGYFGDVAALGVFRALGRPDGRATSLDNTLRLGTLVDTEWVLLDMRTHLVVGGYGHATVYLWSPDGTLLGLMSQSVALRNTAAS
jgi:acyl-CoA thioesterase